MSDKVNIFVPVDFKLEKSISGEEHGNYVRGWATTPDLDLEGDIILPEEIDISYFLSRGYINYEHKSGVGYRVGVPTQHTYVDPEKGLFVEARLFMDNPYAQDMWNLANGLSSVRDETRILGFSVEGRVMSRNVDDPRILEGIQVEHVALTTNPANPNATWEALVKSMNDESTQSVEEDDHPEWKDSDEAKSRNLASTIRDVAYAIKELENDGVTWDKIADDMQDEDRWDEDTALLLLQLSRGVSKEDAQIMLDTYNSGVPANEIENEEVKEE